MDSFYDQYAIKLVLTLILVLIKHYIGDEDKKGTLFIFTSRSCKIENINKKRISNALHFVYVKGGSFRV